MMRIKWQTALLSIVVATLVAGPAAAAGYTVQYVPGDQTNVLTYMGVQYANSFYNYGAQGSNVLTMGDLNTLTDSANTWFAGDTLTFTAQFSFFDNHPGPASETITVTLDAVNQRTGEAFHDQQSWSAGPNTKYKGLTPVMTFGPYTFNCNIGGCPVPPLWAVDVWSVTLTVALDFGNCSNSGTCFNGVNHLEDFAADAI